MHWLLCRTASFRFLYVHRTLKPTVLEVIIAGWGTHCCALLLPWKLLLAVDKDVASMLVCIDMRCGGPVVWIVWERVQLHWPGGHGGIMLREHTMDTSEELQPVHIASIVKAIAMHADDKTNQANVPSLQCS